MTCGFFLQKNPQAVLDLDILDIDADEECLVTKNSPFYGFRKPQDEKEFISIFMFVCLTMVCTFQSGALLDEPGSIVRRGRLGLSLMLDHDGIIMDMFIKGVLKDGGKSAVAGILTGEAWIYANSEYEKIKSMSPDLSRMALFTAINIIIILLSSISELHPLVKENTLLMDNLFRAAKAPFRGRLRHSVCGDRRRRRTVAPVKIFQYSRLAPRDRGGDPISKIKPKLGTEMFVAVL